MKRIMAGFLAFAMLPTIAFAALCYTAITPVCGGAITCTSTCGRAGCGTAISCSGTTTTTRRDVASAAAGGNLRNLGAMTCTRSCTASCPLTHVVPYSATISCSTSPIEFSPRGTCP
jgi:hypothetical protein